MFENKLVWNPFFVEIIFSTTWTKKKNQEEQSIFMELLCPVSLQWLDQRPLFTFHSAQIMLFLLLEVILSITKKLCLRFLNYLYLKKKIKKKRNSCIWKSNKFNKHILVLLNEYSFLWPNHFKWYILCICLNCLFCKCNNQQHYFER